MTTSQARSLQAGLVALEQGRYAEAVSLLETACQQEKPGSVEGVRSQINLARAYERTQQFDKALALSQQLIMHPDPRVHNWAKQASESLKSVVVAHPTPEDVEQPATLIPNSQSPTPQSPTPQSSDLPLPTELLKTGGLALKEKRFADAVTALEAYIQNTEPTEKEYTQAQMWLAKAYKGNQQPAEAIALTRQLTASADAMVQTWAQQYLVSLMAIAALQVAAPEAASKLNRRLDGDSEAPPSEESAPSANEHPPLKSLNHLKAFYQQHLVKDLKQVERSRKALVQQIIFTSIVLLLLPGLVALILISKGADFFFWILAGYTVMLTLWVGAYSHFTTNYSQNFKALRIVEKIVHGIDPNLDYSPYGIIAKYSLRDAYRDSSLFRHLANPDRFSEDDSVSGWIGDTFITFGEICAESEQTDYRRDNELRMKAFSGIAYVVGRLAKGQRISFNDFINEVYGDTTRSILFKGILFSANFNKQFKYRTIVLPDFAEKFFGGFGQAFQSMNKRHGELVKLEDPEFEKLFAVYSEDQIEARYLLSTNLMERLTRFRKRSGHDVSVSFVNNSIYVAIAYEEDLFEPKLFKSMLDFKPIQNYFENLQLVIGIVEDLKLNRRIWGK